MRSDSLRRALVLALTGILLALPVLAAARSPQADRAAFRASSSASFACPFSRARSAASS
ncbi:MAG TPA: hypothetical protein VMM92_03450 [Thermoanaerobaculia bacterium]|nr:hypothetical protein [Thermoanaerobaculia bacterium]